MKNTGEVYVSTDAETDGPIPGPHSMLSFASAAYRSDKTLIGTFSANLETLVNCAVFDRAPRSPAQGGHAWFELTTEHFVLSTDLDEAAARTSTQDAEAAYRALEQVAFPGYEHLAQRLNIVLFCDSAEFHRFWPRDMGGFSLDRPPRDLERAPTMVLFGDLRGDSRVAFLHELTHLFMARAYGWAPAWMNEGLAVYFSTMRVEGARAILGEVPDGALVAPSLVPSVGELVAADRAGFYGTWTGEDYDDLHRMRYYAGAYAFVHLLRHGPEGLRRRFDVFVDAMNDGARANGAWTRTFGTIPSDALEEMFSQHLADLRQWDLFEARINPVSSPVSERTRTMRDEEVHLLWARIMTRAGDNGQGIREQLAQAFAQAPGSSEVAYARGCFELAEKRVGSARTLFEGALAQEPDNPRYVYAVLRARVQGGNALGELLERLERLARSAEQLSAVALYESSRGDRDAARRLADQAVAADPGYAAALATRARVRFQAGDAMGAVADQEHALALLPEHVDDRPLVRDLREYRQAHARDGDAGK